MNHTVKGSRIDIHHLWMREEIWMWGWELEGSGGGRIERESTREDNCNMRHLWGKLKTKYNENSHQSTKVALAKTPRLTVSLCSFNMGYFIRQFLENYFNLIYCFIKPMVK